MPKLTVNGNEVEFEQGMTVLQACEIAGEEIPRFCYHERLKIAGNCRMCLVQIEGGPPKPAASCAMPAGDGMIVHTNTPMVKKAREGVMEFQLINHPLDCPICDQAGECDLQDQAVAYGRGESRYNEEKHAVKDKYMGPIIKPHMTRCVQCTRCIRFLDDVAGVEVMGAIGRGEDMEVGTFIEQGINSELSGNIIDLCPVGALTSKPYAFRARSWELQHTESVDVMDAVGSNIRVDSRGNEVMRILPRLNEDINEEWISDKTRYACDGLRVQRLDRPYIRKNGKLKESSWSDALEGVANKIKSVKGDKIAAIAGDMADAESMYLLKKLLKDIGSDNIDCCQDGSRFDAENRVSYLFNSTIVGIENADALLIIGSNPRKEAAIVNARIRKCSLQANFPIGYIGADIKLNYKINGLGESPDIVEEIVSGKSEFSKILDKAERPAIIVGTEIFKRTDADAIMAAIYDLCDKYAVIEQDWNGLNILHQAASRVAGLDLGFVPSGKGKNTSTILKGGMELLFLLGADEIDTSKLEGSFVVYIGSHGDAGASIADIILPAAAYTEKTATYVNIEGRPQSTRQAVIPPAEAKEDWKIINELTELVGSKSYKNLKDLRADMFADTSCWSDYDEIIPAKWKKFGQEGKIQKKDLTETIENFYMTDPISRSSKTMANCTAEFVVNTSQADEIKGKKKAA